MANYLQLGQGLMKHLPTAEGCTSTVKLSKKGIEALAKKNSELGKVIEGMTRGAENPTLEIAQKAKGNYAIAGFKIRNGETVLGKGAYSTSTGANGVVEKMHVESGDIITTVTQKGDKVVSKNVSKSELAKVAQEKAKASEFMTEEIIDANGEKALKRKFKDGTTVISKTLNNGQVKTSVRLADGTEYTRIKDVSRSLIENSKALKRLYPDMCFGFERVNKDISYIVGGKTYKEAPKGVIYGTKLVSSSPHVRRIPLLQYEGHTYTVPNKAPEVYEYIVKEPKHKMSNGVTLTLGQRNVYGHNPANIQGQETLRDWEALKFIKADDLRKLLP